MTGNPAPRLCDLGELLRHDQWLRRLAARLVHGHDVDDLVQDTMHAALVGRLDPERPLQSWLARVARRLAARSRRAAVRRQRRERRAAVAEAVPSTDATVALLELQRRVAAAVAGMAEPYRTAILLRYYHDQDTAAIAAHCGCSHDAVRKRIERGLDELRTRLRDAYGEEWRFAAPLVLMARRPRVLGSTAAAGAGTFMMLSKPKLAVAALCVAAASLLTYWATVAAGIGVAATPEAPPEAALTAPAIASAATRAEAGDQHRSVVPTATEAPMPCRGRILDPSGTPLAGVTIVFAERLAEEIYADEARQETKAPRAPRPRIDLAALAVAGVSAADGAFAVGLERGQYLLAGAGFATLRAQLLTGPAEGLLVVAAPAATVRCLVVDRSGSPIERARVTVRLPPLGDFPAALDGTRDNSVPPTFTSADGSFTLDLAAGLGELAIAHRGFLTAVQKVPATSGDLRIELRNVEQTHLVVTGHVVDGAGLAIADAIVGLHGASARSDEMGTFQLVFDSREHAPPPDSVLFAAHAGYQTRILPGFGAQVADPDHRDVTVQLEGPALAIAGRVVTASGEPQTGALVCLWNEPALLGNRTAEELAMSDATAVAKVGPGLRVWSRTDAGGNFELTGLAAKDYRLRVLVDAPRAAITSEPVAAVSRGIEVRLPAQLVHDIKGRVTTERGEPVAGVQVQSNLVLYRAGGCTFTDTVSKMVSAADGRFELRSVPVEHAVLSCSGDPIVPCEFVVDPQRRNDDQQVVVVRRCHFRIQVDGTAIDRFAVLDAADQPLEILRIGTDGIMYTRLWRLEDGSSGVLAVSEKAATLSLRIGTAEVARLPIRLVPGEVTAVRY